MRLALNVALVAAVAMGAAACSSTPAKPGNRDSDQKAMELLMSGRKTGPELDAAIKQALKHPLGSPENPVRADLVIGEHAYLNRLRCADGAKPSYERPTTPSVGVYGSKVDTYDVICATSEPRHTIIVMDMYFPGYVERKAPEGYTIVAP